MKYYENEWFEIICSDDDQYKNLIIEAINNKTQEIANFFGVSSLKHKKKVIIYYSIEDFKKYLIPHLRDNKYYDWMIGSTHDGNINQLCLECCRQTNSHKNITEKDYIDGIVHEIVHIFHHEIRKTNMSHYCWFDEALATNLSNQDYNIVPFTCTLEELTSNFNNIKNQYDISYTIGRYMLENYSHELILSICKDETILDKIALNLFEEMREYAKNNHKRR